MSWGCSWKINSALRWWSDWLNGIYNAPARRRRIKLHNVHIHTSILVACFTCSFLDVNCSKTDQSAFTPKLENVVNANVILYWTILARNSLTSWWDWRTGCHRKASIWKYSILPRALKKKNTQTHVQCPSPLNLDLRMKMRNVLSHSRCRRLTWSLWRRWRWNASVVASLISWWCYHDALRLPVSITIRCQSLVSNDIPKQLQASTNFFMTGKTLTHNRRTGGKCPEPVADDVKVCPVWKKKKILNVQSL